MSKKPTLKELEQQVAELTDALLRERADAINVRRRAEEDRIKFSGFYKANVIRDLLTFIDNLDRAIIHAPKSKDVAWEKWFSGLVGVRKQLEQALEKIGVERIQTVGEHFNPELHEAISMEEGDGDTEVVTEELQAGYKVGDEIIRHAMVKVTMQ